MAQLSLQKSWFKNIMPKSDPLFHAGHRERLKEKLLDDKLTSYEKLELLLTYAIPRRDVRPAARALIARFRSVYGVLHASIEDLQTVSGIGHNTALLIHLVHQLMLISHREQLSDGNVLADPNVIKEYCRKNLVGKCVEELHIMYLDTKFRLIDDETHSRGTIDQSAAYPREICRRAHLLNASAVILAHNHPQSDNSFSSDDVMLTELIRNELAKINVAYIDHYVVTSTGTVHTLSETMLLHQSSVSNK